MGDFSANAFAEIMQAAHYLAVTGRIEAADTIYHNLLKTAYDWGVTPRFCSILLLEYANFLKYQGNEKESEPYFKELVFRAEGDKPVDSCYGLAGTDRGDYLPIRWNFIFFHDNHFWAPEQADTYIIAPESADKSSPLNASGRIIYTTEIGKGTAWQSAYNAYSLIKARNFGKADKAVQALLSAEQAKYTHGKYDIVRLMNFAAAYDRVGQLQQAKALRLSLLPLMAEPRQAINRAQLLFDPRLFF